MQPPAKAAVLAVIHDTADEPLTTKQITDRTGYSVGTIRAAINALLYDGYIVLNHGRWRLARDGVAFAATEDGQQTLADARATVNA